MTRKQATKSEKQSYVDQFHQSGLTQSAFCRQHGLVGQTFNTWLHDLSPSSCDAAYVVCDLSELEPTPQNAFIPIQCFEDEAVSYAINAHHAQKLPESKIHKALEETAPATLCLRIKSFCLDVPLNLSTDSDLSTVRSVIEMLHNLGDGCA